MNLLADLTAELTDDATLIKEIREANTARHVLELTTQAGISTLPEKICQKVAENCLKFAKSPLVFHVTMVNFSGEVLAYYTPKPKNEDKK